MLLDALLPAISEKHFITIVIMMITIIIKPENAETD